MIYTNKRAPSGKKPIPRSSSCKRPRSIAKILDLYHCDTPDRCGGNPDEVRTEAQLLSFETHCLRPHLTEGRAPISKPIFLYSQAKTSYSIPRSRSSKKTGLVDMQRGVFSSKQNIRKSKSRNNEKCRGGYLKTEPRTITPYGMLKEEKEFRSANQSPGLQTSMFLSKIIEKREENLLPWQKYMRNLAHNS
jgi:hypothetical protein